MATEETRRRLNDLRILEESTNKGKGESSRKRKVEESTNKGKEKVESTNKGKGKSIDGKTPTKIEESGRKYCCAKCYHSYGRVTHVDLEIRVTMEPNAVVSGAKGPGRKLYYTLNFPGINSHRVEAGMLDHNTSIRKLNTVCNFCGEILGWHFTDKNDYMMKGAWCTTMMDREKVVLLDEEENEVARDCDSEMPRINYLKRMNLEQVLPQGKAFRRGRPVLAQEIAQVLAQVTAIKPAPRNLKWDYFA